MPSKRDIQAANYDPKYNKQQFASDYNSMIEQGSLPDRPKVQPHHIRGLNNWYDAFMHLTPENRILLQDELEPYGLNFGDDKNNLQAAEGQWSKSSPGETRYGGQHSQLHREQETSLQELGFDRSNRAYRGVGGVPWSQMTQDQIMGFIRSGALADEMTVNRTLSTGLSLRTSNGSVSIDTSSAQEFFPNRLTAQPQPTPSTDTQIWNNFLETTRPAPKPTPLRQNNGTVGLDMGNRLTNRRNTFRGTAGPIGTGVSEAFNTPYNINESDPLGGSTYMPEVEAPIIKGV